MYFNDCYRGNPPGKRNVRRSYPPRRYKAWYRRRGGNAVMIVGAFTGRDGIGGGQGLCIGGIKRRIRGKSFADAGGGPLHGKNFCWRRALSCLKPGTWWACRTLGAAGLTSASSETASRGGSGMDIDVALVPRRGNRHDSGGSHDFGIPGAHAGNSGKRVRNKR